MSLMEMIEQMKRGPRYPEMGMIASHLGVVRGSSLDGRIVKGIQIEFFPDDISDIVIDISNMEGIVDVLVETYPGTLKVGDEVMAVVVGGDTREHVFPALVGAVNEIKARGSRKKEIF